ncbi:hypothetical protein ABT300_37865 [Streptomyces sp. NPDC001027]|uniref:hypothetical protein n=1 Tax=Streptomyces sp. NPDC001027 TaxID=3154771 RepID=UPI003316A557
MFNDRLPITLICLRHDPPHVAMAELYGVDCSTVSTAVREVRASLAERGFAISDGPA